MTSSAVFLLFLLILSESLVARKIFVPNFRDLTIETRRVDGDSRSRTDILYLKGARQRIESGSENSDSDHSWTASILYECDRRRILTLNSSTKTFHERFIKDPSEKHPAAEHKNTIPPPAQSADTVVNISRDSVDTGERRQVEGYTARHVKTTTKTEPGPKAATHASLEETDGWYLDLPGFACLGSLNSMVGFFLPAPSPGDKLHFNLLGTAPHGYPIEETVRKTEEGRTSVTKLTLVQVSKTALDPKLFEVPADYVPALETPHGGYDLTKPDTLANRLQVYWTGLELWTKQWFR
jgi:hypothetical protein